MIQIGTVKKTHGLKGALTIVHELPDDKWIKIEDVFVLENQSGNRLPHVVKSVQSVGEAGQAIVMFEGVTDADTAKFLVGQRLLLSVEHIQTLYPTFPLAWIGLQLHDKSFGLVGEIADVVHNGPQWIGIIPRAGKDVLVPLVSAYDLVVDWKAKTVTVDLPEGFLDIYLS